MGDICVTNVTKQEDGGRSEGESHQAKQNGRFKEVQSNRGESELRDNEENSEDSEPEKTEEEDWEGEIWSWDL